MGSDQAFCRIGVELRMVVHVVSMFQVDNVARSHLSSPHVHRAHKGLSARQILDSSTCAKCTAAHGSEIHEPLFNLWVDATGCGTHMLQQGLVDDSQLKKWMVESQWCNNLRSSRQKCTRCCSHWGCWRCCLWQQGQVRITTASAAVAQVCYAIGVDNWVSDDSIQRVCMASVRPCNNLLNCGSDFDRKLAAWPLCRHRHRHLVPLGQ
jgi:hypothetical protein